MITFNYAGNGSEKQVAWASQIVMAEVNAINEAYSVAKLRVEEGSMPAIWLEIWNDVLVQVQGAIDKNFANASASHIIDIRTKISGTVSARAIAAASARYQAAR